MYVASVWKGFLIFFSSIPRLTARRCLADGGDFGAACFADHASHFYLHDFAAPQVRGGVDDQAACHDCNA